MSRNDASKAQVIAADPARSTWVSANAGSGKTRVLTDRVARLLLNEVPPQRILCLTYTKAAAAHMQNKLFERLGAWAMQEEAALRAALAELGEAPERLDSDFLRRARTLFARALETPGGLKIQTIHAFCASVLRRFPLEAGVSPAFREMDERSGQNLRAEVLEAMAGSPDPAPFDALARHFSGGELDRLLQEIGNRRDAFARPPPDSAAFRRRFGLPGAYDEAAYLRAVRSGDLPALLSRAAEALLGGSSNDVKLAASLAEVASLTPGMEMAVALERLFVYGSRVREDKIGCAKLDRVPTRPGGVGDRHPELVAELHGAMQRFAAARPRRQALMTAQKAEALYRFAHAYLAAYDVAKARHGWLDFDDLILKTRDLLSDPSTAQWVLYRLDGGIDHILVDEAQDTNPEQWQVIAQLAEEFFAGHGARPVPRTLFAVGDRKQSIFSFQGADPAQFDLMAGRFGDRLARIGEGLQRRELLYSFRSSGAILQLVDRVFGALPDAGMQGTTHRAFHDRLPGRVDLWPCLEPPQREVPPEWFRPLDRPDPSGPTLLLARRVAGAIRGMLERGERLPQQDGDRPLRPGDFLILVQGRRSPLFREIIRALKEEGLPIAGADRLRIGGELAVRDLLALLAFLATPEDDLSLACVLRSPLGGLSEEELHRLAQGRNGHLWPELRRAAGRHQALLEMLHDLRDQADFLRPYELLERILTRHRGRDRLIARLGHEAEDGIDALLSQALVFEQAEPPSLTGFLSWMEGDESDIKRQVDAESDQIRVMTVHGAKGLESPVVILPDTVSKGRNRLPEILLDENGGVCWKLGPEDRAPLLRAAAEAAETARRQERMRLLYVALTRAENWLIVCGAGKRGDDADIWYNMVETAMGVLPVRELESDGTKLRRFEPLGWPAPDTRGGAPAQPSAPGLPKWLNAHAPPPAPRPPVITPSGLGGAKIVEGADAGRDEAAALRRGNAVHLLLQQLPGFPEASRRDRAGALLDGGGFDPADPALAGCVEEALAVLEAPALAHLFAPGTLAEVALCAPLSGGIIDGAIDRLIVEPDRVLAVDFKTNAAVPGTAAETPEGLLRQMGAYAHALAQIYPGRRIETAILWTRSGRLMTLPADIVTDALSRATLP